MERKSEGGSEEGSPTPPGETPGDTSRSERRPGDSEAPPRRGAAHSSAPPPRRAGDSEAPPSLHHERVAARTNVAAKAIRGIFWVASTGLGARIVSLVSTLLLTRFVTPDDYGEVQNTYVIVWMIDLLTQLGLPQYIAGRADITKKHIAHSILFFHGFGFVGMGLCLALARPLGPIFGAPHMYLYMPGFVVALLFQRLATIPDRLLVRDLRFRAVSVIRAMGEIVYALTSLGLAWANTRLDFDLFGVSFLFGNGFAIVWGGIARGLFRVVAMAMLIRVRDWFAFPRVEKEITRDVLAFGLPITMAGLGGLGSRRFDNLAIGNLYGPATTGTYNLAYNLADVPPGVVGEALGDVLAPSFAKVDPRDRPRELRRWVGFSALLCFPLGVGLSAVAPSLTLLLSKNWYSALPMLMLLGMLSLTRPVIGTVFSYLQLLGRTRTLMVLEWMKAALIVVTIAGAGRLLRLISPDLDARYGAFVACVMVGVVHAANMLTYQVTAARVGGFPASRIITPLFRPLIACVPMVAAVLLVRIAFGDVESRLLQVLRLVCEILAGGLIFVGAAWVIARDIVTDFLHLVKTSLLKRRSSE